MEKLKEELKYGKKGITLISLVVTIIVLLILAGVTIATLTGENGILTRASEAKEKTEEAQEKEGLELAVTSSQMEDVNTLEITEEKLSDAIKQQFGNNKDFSITDNGDGSFLVSMNDTQRMYYIDETGKIIDPFNGREDLKNHIIRATTLHFKEDPLRVYRVARFSAGLQFNVEENTINLMRELKNELNTLSKERVYTEFSKALLTDKPSIFFDILRKSDTLDVHFKEVKDLIGAEQPPQYHPEGDAYNHTMLVLDKATELTSNFAPNRKLEIRFSALVHDFGKGVTPKEQYPHHYGHETAGAKIVSKFGHNIKAPNNLIKCGKTACLEHMRGGIFYKMKPSKKVEFIERVSKSILGLDGLQIVVMADKTSGGRENNIDDISFEKIGKRCLKEINGEYIEKKYNLKPGLQFGNKLHEERIKWIKENLNNIQN